MISNCYHLINLNWFRYSAMGGTRASCIESWSTPQSQESPLLHCTVSHWRAILALRRSWSTATTLGATRTPTSPHSWITSPPARTRPRAFWIAGSWPRAWRMQITNWGQCLPTLSFKVIAHAVKISLHIIIIAKKKRKERNKNVGLRITITKWSPLPKFLIFIYTLILDSKLIRSVRTAFLYVSIDNIIIIKALMMEGRWEV